MCERDACCTCDCENGDQSCGANLCAFMFHSAQFAIDVFWGLIMSLTTPYMEEYFGASKEFTTILWMTAPFAGLLFATFSGSLVVKLGDTPSAQRCTRIAVMGISLLFVIGFSTLFVYMPFIGGSQSESDRVSLLPWAVLVFFLLMVAINFYMPSYWSSKYLFSNQIVSKFAPAFWGALGQIFAMQIIQLPNLPLDDAKRMLVIFSICLGSMLIFTLISFIPMAHLKLSDKEDESKGGNQRFSCEDVLLKPFEGTIDYWHEGGWLTAIVMLCSWASLYSIMPYANSWYAEVICGQKPGDPGYTAASTQFSRFRLYQQVVAVSGSVAAMGIEFFTEKSQSNKDSPDYDKDIKEEGYSYYAYLPRFRNLCFQSIIQLIGLAALVGGLVAVGFAGQHDETLIMYAFSVTGLGSVAIIPFREFQRSFLRYLRFRRNPTEELKPHEKIALCKSYASRDSIYDAVIFNNFICLGQILIFTIHEFAYKSIGYSYLFQLVGGGFGILAILFILLSLTPCIESGFDEKNGSYDFTCFRKCLLGRGKDTSHEVLDKQKAEGQFYPSVVSKSGGSRIVFRAQRKKHYV
jgi:hypothetical protein